MAEQDIYPDGYSKEAHDISADTFTTETALRIRLDTTMLKLSIQNFLEGKRETLEEYNNTLIKRVVPTGKPMANKIGIQRIMAYIEHFVNSHTFQGNIKPENYELLMEMARQEFSNNIGNNMYNYGIDENELNLIADNVMNLIMLTASRPINNEERKSYVGTVIHSENSQANYAKQKSGIWDKFKVGK